MPVVVPSGRALVDHEPDIGLHEVGDRRQEDPLEHPVGLHPAPGLGIGAHDVTEAVASARDRVRGAAVRRRPLAQPAHEPPVGQDPEVAHPPHAQGVLRALVAAQFGERLRVHGELGRVLDQADPCVLEVGQRGDLADSVEHDVPIPCDLRQHEGVGALEDPTGSVRPVRGDPRGPRGGIGTVGAGRFVVGRFGAGGPHSGHAQRVEGGGERYRLSPVGGHGASWRAW